MAKLIDSETIRIRWRGALASVAVLLAVATGWQWSRRASTAARFDAWLEETGLDARQPELVAQIRHEQDPAWASNLLARALLADELDQGWIAGLPEAARRVALEGGARRLEIAAEAAAEVLAKHPSSWEAALVLGGVRYLQSVRRHPGAAAGIEAWEAPLLLAKELGPERLDPDRLLAAAYVSQWASLDAERRARAPEALRSALRDRNVFQSLIGPWLRVAPSREVAFAAVPDTADAWMRLSGIYSARREWDRLADARSRWYAALLAELREEVDEGTRRLRTGDRGGGLRLYSRAVGRAPLEASFAPLLAEILVEAPSGWVEPAAAGRLEQWLTFVVERAVAGEVLLPPAAGHRLSAELELSPPQAAAAALLAGQKELAAFHARQAEPAPTAEWLPYLALESSLLATSRPAEAREVLARASAVDAASPLLYLAAARLPPDARQPPAPAGWQKSADGYRLGLLAPAGASGLILDFTDDRHGASEGGAVEVRLDGALIGIFAVRPGTRVRLSTPVSRGPHLVEALVAGGAPPIPGSVTLRP